MCQPITGRHSNIIRPYGIDGFPIPASKYKYDQTPGCHTRDYHETNPEFVERFDHFVFDKVINKKGQTFNSVTRHMRSFPR